MAWKRYEIETYEVRLVACNTPGYEPVTAFVYLTWSGSRRATLWFYRSGDPLPQNVEVARDKGVEFYARFEQSQFATAIGLLRHEHPVYFHWDSDNCGAFLGTRQEPVGEHESSERTSSP
ncbi:MAG: hypothetical protein ACPG77_00355 [Nannocystaceae bacterium]